MRFMVLGILRILSVRGRHDRLVVGLVEGDDWPLASSRGVGAGATAASCVRHVVCRVRL